MVVGKLLIVVEYILQYSPSIVSLTRSLRGPRARVGATFAVSSSESSSSESSSSLVVSRTSLRPASQLSARRAAALSLPSASPRSSMRQPRSITLLFAAAGVCLLYSFAQQVSQPPLILQASQPPAIAAVPDASAAAMLSSVAQQSHSTPIAPAASAAFWLPPAGTPSAARASSPISGCAPAPGNQQAQRAPILLARGKGNPGCAAAAGAASGLQVPPDQVAACALAAAATDGELLLLSGGHLLRSLSHALRSHALTTAAHSMAPLTGHAPLACTSAPACPGGGGAQSLESLRLRLLAAREAAPGQVLLLALDAPARDLAHSLGVGWWFVPTRLESAAAAEAVHWRAAALLLRAGCSVVRSGGVGLGVE